MATNPFSLSPPPRLPPLSPSSPPRLYRSLAGSTMTRGAIMSTSFQHAPTSTPSIVLFHAVSLSAAWSTLYPSRSTESSLAYLSLLILGCLSSISFPDILHFSSVFSFNITLSLLIPFDTDCLSFRIFCRRLLASYLLLRSNLLFLRCQCRERK